jgi:hypothetical protein
MLRTRAQRRIEGALSAVLTAFLIGLVWLGSQSGDTMAIYVTLAVFLSMIAGVCWWLLRPKP